MLNSFIFQTRTRVLVGDDLASDIPSLFTESKNLYLLTDKGVREAGLVDHILSSLDDSRLVGIAADVPVDSDTVYVETVAAKLRNLEVDGLIALGGGSVIDTAKAVNLLLKHGGQLNDYQGYGVINGPLYPLLAIPTTAGTGSEMTRYAVIKDRESRLKISLISPFLMPDVAMLMPSLTTSLSPSLTASTGMDALTHAIEAYVSLDSNPFSDALAIEAIRLIHDNLLLAVKDGRNLEARYHLLVASSLAGMAFDNALVGCVHAMAHALGGQLDVPHGLANSILLPHGLEYNLREAEEKMQKLSLSLGIGKTAEDLVAWVKELGNSIGLPVSLKELGIKETQLPAIAEAAVLDGAIHTNPREANNEEILRVLLAAFHG